MLNRESGRGDLALGIARAGFILDVIKECTWMAQTAALCSLQGGRPVVDEWPECLVDGLEREVLNRLISCCDKNPSTFLQFDRNLCAKSYCDDRPQ